LWEEEGQFPKGLLTAGIVAGVVGVTGTVAAPFILAGIGFGAAGVAAGSIAAAIQGPATLAGGWFALCQSAGAIGMAVTTQAGIGAASGTVAGAIAAIVVWTLLFQFRHIYIVYYSPLNYNNCT